MRAFVRLRLGELDKVLHPGDLVGRNASCALSVTDPRVSEAHAMVSLRGTSLKLLALRGRFAVGERVATEVELSAGLKVELARGLNLEVLEVGLPAEVLALEARGMPRQALSGVCSLRVGPRPELVPGFSNESDALFFSDGHIWFARFESEDRPLVVGDVLTIANLEVRVVTLALAASGHAATIVHGRIDDPLTIVVRYDTVHIRQSTRPSLVLDGLLARIVSELAVIALPVAWESVAREVWPDEADLISLRRRWDTSVARLRKKLRDAGLRTDLVRADGTGNFELFLEGEDRLEDQT